MVTQFLPKEVEALWTLFTAPTVWAAHFLTCYVGTALYCALGVPAGLGFGVLRFGIAGVTAVALAAVVVAAALAWRQHGFGTGDPPHDAATRRDRLLFQGFATLLLCGLSFVAIVFEALPALFLADCRP